MPSKRYEIWLTERLFMVVEIGMAGGRVVSFCVRLMLLESGNEHNIARYDTAHGVPHRDVLDRNGRILQKAWFPDQPLEAVLNYAVDDFKLHGGQYAQTWQNQ